MDLNLNKCIKGPMSCIIAMILMLYVLSPIDFVPELLLGPIGLIDDVVAVLVAFQVLGGNLFKTAKGVFK